MAKSQELANFEKMVEKIIFDEEELETLKIAIKNFTDGKTSSKELKRLLLQCRGRMVEDLTDFAFFISEKLQTRSTKQPQPSPTESESNLIEEIAERNELLVTVAKRINAYLRGESNISSREEESLKLDEIIKNEIERVFLVIDIDEWLIMCRYDDYKFYTKLYNKLEGLYRQEFEEGKKKFKTSNKEPENMPGKIVKLNFPENVTTELMGFISIRNNITHNNWDIAPSDVEIAHNSFVSLLIYLIVSYLDVQLLSGNEQLFYNYLRQCLSSNLEKSPKFLTKIESSLNTYFTNYNEDN